jgi:hypothetical protein
MADTAKECPTDVSTGSLSAAKAVNGIDPSKSAAVSNKEIPLPAMCFILLPPK